MRKDQLNSQPLMIYKHQHKPLVQNVKNIKQQWKNLIQSLEFEFNKSNNTCM
jgi:hypothetical protein